MPQGSCFDITSGSLIVSVPVSSVQRSQINAKHHARISTGSVWACFCHRAAEMPEVPPEPHAAVEARGGIIRLWLPNIRVPEVRSYSQDGRIERSHDLGYARLARQWTKTADI